MKTTHILIAIAGLILIAGGCMVQPSSESGDPRTKYVVKFDTPTKLVNKEKFIAALKKGSWRRDIAFKPKEPSDPTPDDTGSPISASVVHTIAVTQDSHLNPDGVHVTQRVGLNGGQEKDLEELLKYVKQ